MNMEISIYTRFEFDGRVARVREKLFVTELTRGYGFICMKH